MPPLDLIIRKFESPDEVRTFEKGKLELIHIHGMTIGRASYGPGWRWSQHVQPTVGTKSCQVEHIGMVLQGRCAVKMDDGRMIEMRPGELFYVAPYHDSWVIGDETYVSLISLVQAIMRSPDNR